MTEVTAIAMQPVVSKQEIDQQVEKLNGIVAQLGSNLVNCDEFINTYSSSVETANARAKKAMVAAKVTQFEVGRASLSLLIAALGIGSLILLKGSHRKALQGTALLTTLLSTWQAAEAAWVLKNIRAKAKQSQTERDLDGTEAKKLLQDNNQLLATYKKELAKLEQLQNTFKQAPVQ